MEIKFTTEESIRQTDRIVDFLLGSRWGISQSDYPDYREWLKKVHTQLKTETKRSLVAFIGGGIVGVVIYQQHTDLPRTLELKNITVRPSARGRYVASFLLRNAEIEGAADFNAEHVVVDTKEVNYGMRGFLGKHRYQELGIFDIYQKGAGHDVLLQKTL